MAINSTTAIALLTLSLSMLPTTARADIRLPRLVGDGMVLQRDAPLKLWGWADPGERIAIQFVDQKRQVTARADGSWSIALAPLPAGGPYTMQLRGKRSMTLRNVLIGDVWLASGQSNMEFPLQPHNGFGGVIDADRESAGADFPRMRLFIVKHDLAFEPRDDVSSDGWQPVTAANAARFSAVAYLFGRELYRRYQIPIGLIESSWGGTPAECWVSARGLQPFAQFAPAITREARVDAGTLADYQHYLDARDAWYRQHGREDRGRAGAEDLWAQSSYSAADWPTTTEPQPWPRKSVKDFDGTMWFRKTVQLPANLNGDARLHLPHLREGDTTYVNGARVGATRGESAERDYPLAHALLRPGANTITLRVDGAYASGDGYVGILGAAADFYLQIGSSRLPLAGTWSFQPGPDLSALPDPPPLAEFMFAFPQQPTLLSNAMIAPLTRYRIRGALWYQGEANVERAQQYRALFPALIRDWRSRWGYPLPFLFVQLAGYGSEPSEPGESDWAELRESQAAALALPATAMAVAIDIGDANDIHPRNKQAVAHRLALAAERAVYGEQILASGPRYRGQTIEHGKLRLRFEDVGSGLTVGSPSGELRGFAVAGADGVFHWAQARLDGAQVLVWSAAVPAPIAVRYDWGNTPHGNLYNREGLPAAPFRSR
jgi:sialate O-acetylesterase